MFEIAGIIVLVCIVILAIRWYGYNYYYKAGQETRSRFDCKSYTVLRHKQERVLRDCNTRAFDRAFARGFCFKSKDFKEVFRWRH